MCLVLSLGPHVRPLYAALRELVPGYAQIRSLWRFGILAQVSITLLAAVGIEALIGAGPTRRRTIAAMAVALLSTLELRAGAVPLVDAPSPDEYAELLEWIATNTDPGEPIAFLPPAHGRGSKAHEETAGWMLLQASFDRPTVGGYSSFFPESYRALRDAAPLLPEGPAVELLRGAGAHFVVVRPSWRSPEQLEPAGMIPLTRRSGYDIYDLSAISPGPRPRGSR